MSKKLTLIFDLDGTLLDSKKAICASMNFSFAKHNLPTRQESEIAPLIGRPMREIYTTLTGLSYSDVQPIVDSYREHYESEGFQVQDLFPGVRELLEKFSAECYLTIATLKPEFVAKNVLKHCGVLEYFDVVSGINLANPVHDKIGMLQGIFDNNQNLIKSPSVMVGDRDVDIIAGKFHSSYSIGAAYGFGSKQELLEAGADYVADDFYQIKQKIAEKFALNW